MDKTVKTNKLSYTIHKYSSFSAHYIPQHIMVNKPSDQLSRWFTDSFTPSQFITLKLEHPALVEIIKFGKYMKPHVSDLKKFQVYGGTDDNNMSLLLTAGLRKDNAAETFRLRHVTQEGLPLPVKYIKIVPLQSWGPASNFTIWYIELLGKNQEELVTKALDTLNMRKEEEAIRILLKHLRRRRYKEAFEALSRESGVRLEGPVQSRLWNALVENKDYKLAEKIFEDAAKDGELEWYMSWQPYIPEWRQLCGCSSSVVEILTKGDQNLYTYNDRSNDILCSDREPRLDFSEVSLSDEEREACSLMYSNRNSNPYRPGPRGGHQLVVDPHTGSLYLFGGWNGTEDLDDLWRFDPNIKCWTLLYEHSGENGGPSPRSCHKMVFDPVNHKLYTIGRYLDNAQRKRASLKSDLYEYCVYNERWTLLQSDTASKGGPQLVFDHQLCLDPHTRTIYVFGGRVLFSTADSAMPHYSGLYAYNMKVRQWQQLLPDEHKLPAPQSRVSHSMLFHPTQRRLYIFAGQRNKEQLLDVWSYEVDTGRWRAICAGANSAIPAAVGAQGTPGLETPANPAPAAGFTQRATIDPDTDEIFVLSGMSKEKDKRVYNTLWALSLRRLSWSCVYRNDSVAPEHPRPRFAHQFVYDPRRKIHYLFGGNPGSAAIPQLRLDDLWSLQLKRPSLQSVVETARSAVREACYRELAADPSLAPAALHYLRHDLADVTDHNNPVQVSHFQKLATLLFSGEKSEEYSPVSLSPRRVHTLASRRARAPLHADHVRVLAQVLGIDDSLPEPTQPFEECVPPSPEAWDADHDEEDDPVWDSRQSRILLYDTLTQYFKPSTVPPRGDIMDLVTL